MKDFEFYTPRSLEETLSLLNKGSEQVKIMAGGTDLVVQMKNDLASPDVLIDIKKIPELNRLEMSVDGTLHIGAAVPMSKITAFAPVMQKFNILYQACSILGSVQIRHRATMGGNICNAAPSADSAPPLLCLGARAVVAQPLGMREIPLEKFFQGPGQTVLTAGELLVEIKVPALSSFTAGCYLRHTPRQEMDIAVVGAGVLVVKSDQGNQCRSVKIGLGAVAPTPMRAVDAEAFLTGKTLDDEDIEKTAEIAAGGVSPISDIRASAEYRRELVKALVRRALRRTRETLENLN